MNKLVAFFMLIGCIGTSWSQKTLIDTISSKKLNEKRVVEITLPASYGLEKDRKYPLLVVLDNEFLGPAFRGNLEYANYWEDIPEMIVVGVNQNRNNERELDSGFDPDSGVPDDRGAQFFDFIGSELMPAVLKNYRVAPLKIIAGLDVTAAFANVFLYKDNPMFEGYISISPELPTAMEERIPDRLSKVEKNIWYYHCVADGDIKKMVSRIKTLDEAIKKLDRPNLNYRFDEFKGASHYAQVLYAVPQALYQIFGIYQPISLAEYNDKIVKLEYGYAQYLADKYDMIEKALGMKMKIRLSDFKAIEAAIIKNKAYNEFDLLAQLADKHYPKTLLADYHMAQMYERKEQYDKAIRHYKRAFQMEEIGDLTRSMMLDKAEELRAR